MFQNFAQPNVGDFDWLVPDILEFKIFMVSTLTRHELGAKCHDPIHVYSKNYCQSLANLLPASH